MGLATVYKTLSVLKEMGEVFELSLGEGENRYDGHNAVPHPHVICTLRQDPGFGCGSGRGRDRRAVEASGFHILSHRLDLYGVCPECQQAESGGNPHRTGGSPLYLDRLDQGRNRFAVRLAALTIRYDPAIDQRACLRDATSGRLATLRMLWERWIQRHVRPKSSRGVTCAMDSTTAPPGARAFTIAASARSLSAMCL